MLEESPVIYGSLCIDIIRCFQLFLSFFLGGGALHGHYARIGTLLTLNLKHCTAKSLVLLLEYNHNDTLDYRLTTAGFIHVRYHIGFMFVCTQWGIAESGHFSALGRAL